MRLIEILIKGWEKGIKKGIICPDTGFNRHEVNSAAFKIW